VTRLQGGRHCFPTGGADDKSRERSQRGNGGTLKRETKRAIRFRNNPNVNQRLPNVPIQDGGKKKKRKPENSSGGNIKKNKPRTKEAWKGIKIKSLKKNGTVSRSRAAQGTDNFLQDKDWDEKNVTKDATAIHGQGREQVLL